MRLAKNAVTVLLVSLSVAYGVYGQSATTRDESFGCMREGSKIRNTYIRHPDPVKLKEAVRIFENRIADAEYPVGTILQLVPGEAMVKRTRKEFPNTSGWEFFALDVSAGGTTIRSRGDQAGNRAGTCLSCHQAAAKFDFVCEKSHGCAPVPLTDQRIAELQAGDARCRSSESAR